MLQMTITHHLFFLHSCAFLSLLTCACPLFLVGHLYKVFHYFMAETMLCPQDQDANMHGRTMDRCRVKSFYSKAENSIKDDLRGNFMKTYSFNLNQFPSKSNKFQFHPQPNQNLKLNLLL